MVLQSSENPNKIGFLSRVSDAANEANAPLFSHFHLLLFPILLPKAITLSSCEQMHKHVSVPTSTPAPQGSAGLQPFLWGPLADCARPSSRFVAHSALTPSQPTFSQKLLSSPSNMGPPHVGKGLLGDSLFSIPLILALKPPGIRMRKKSSVSRNDSCWVCEGAVGGRQTMQMVTFPPPTPPRQDPQLAQPEHG